MFRHKNQFFPSWYGGQKNERIKKYKNTFCSHAAEKFDY